MDTNLKYVKMCEKAVEIQALWKWKINCFGDYCWRGKNYLDCAVEIITQPIFQLEGRIWLPRQDQLQEMMFDKEKDIGGAGLTERFNQWLDFWFELDEQPLNANMWSMEQLWLAFVMKEKYGKTWNEKDWVRP